MFPACFPQRAVALRRPRVAASAAGRSGIVVSVHVREDCRHYSRRTVSEAEVVQRCRVDAATPTPFECPQHCLFFEPRPYRADGWSSGP